MTRKNYIKNGLIRSFKVDNERIYATLEINGIWISNPTLESFLADGWKEYIIPEPEPYVPTYEEKVIELIRERYSIDDELAILRLRETKVQEFLEYFAYCEECKRKTKENEL